MTYAIPGQPAKQPPTPVRVAVMLLWAVVALRLVAIGLSFVPTPELDRAIEELYGDNPPPGAAVGTALSVGFGLVVGIVLAAAFGVLAVFLRRGSQAARITTWVFGGIVTLCQACGVIASLVAPTLLSSVTNAGGDPEAQRAAEEAQLILDMTPTWLMVTTTAIEVLVVLALLVALILLAVPSANAYFRKEDEVWVPPTTPGAGYPSYPPPPSQQPPSPPAPGQPPYPPTQS